MSDLLKRLKKNSTIKETETLTESKFYDPDWVKPIPLEVPMLNVALSGTPDGGLTGGVLMICGDSKSFKSGFLVQTVKGFQNKNPNGVCIFYDSEFGIPMSYFEDAGVDTDLIIHTPIKHIEQMKHDLAVQLDNLTEEDEVMIIVDSIGGLASIKEAKDAVEKDESPVDMTRAKALNSVFRIITPHLNIKNIPFVCINHTYDSMEMHSKKTVSGGKKIYLAADDVWIISRQQDGSSSDLRGFRFVVNIDKSRQVIERSKIIIESTFEDGINKNSGLFEEAVEAGLIVQRGAWFQVVDLDTGEVSVNKRRGDIIKDEEFFKRLLAHDPFKEHLIKKYKLIK